MKLGERNDETGEMVIREVEEVPETLLDESLGFVRLLQDTPA